MLSEETKADIRSAYAALMEGKSLTPRWGQRQMIAAVAQALAAVGASSADADQDGDRDAREHRSEYREDSQHDKHGPKRATCLRRLPRGAQSGLTHATNILTGVDGIGFTWFANKDVVRHPLVQRIVEAYEAFEDRAPHTGHRSARDSQGD